MVPAKKNHPVILIVVSAIIAFAAMGQINFVAAWLAFVPLFMIIINASAKQSFKHGFLFGTILSLIAYSWMISGAERFTGYNFLYGAGVFLVSTLFVGLYWGSLLSCFSLLKRKPGAITSVIYNCLIASAVYCLFEYLLSFITDGFPWFSFYAGSGLTENVYAIQPSSLFGIYTLSFVAVSVNYLFAFFIVQKQWKRLIIPAAVVLLYMAFGYFIFQNFNSKNEGNTSVRIAVLTENIPPDIKWDDANGNMLVQRLFQLNKQAAQLKPDIMLWSESTVPWTYRKDDDFVNEILKASASAKATHILGINTEVENNIVKNSAYCILPDGTVTGRYDKQFLLSLIEKPAGSLSIPFFSSKGFIVTSDTVHNAPLPTPYGKAGIIICNESAVDASAYNAVRKGAQFLCMLGNDGWFNNTYIVRNHFYTARLRAVETRKDMVANCNNGYSGLITANGIIVNQQKDTEPLVTMEEVHTNNYKTLATKYPFLFIYVCAGFISFAAAIKIKYKSKRT